MVPWKLCLTSPPELKAPTRVTDLTSFSGRTRPGGERAPLEQSIQGVHGTEGKGLALMIGRTSVLRLNALHTGSHAAL